MLSLTRSDADTFTLVSNDENAENGLLADAIENAAPELLDQYDATRVSDDGLLRYAVARPDWPSLLDALATLEGEVDPDDLNPIIEALDAEVNPA